MILTQTPHNQNVEAMAVKAFHFENSKKSMPMILAYDLDTGILVNAGGIISDPMLREMNITQIWGRELMLSWFSDNLDFKLTQTSTSQLGSQGYLAGIVGVALISILFLTFMYNLNKGRKRAKSRGKSSRRS